MGIKASIRSAIRRCGWDIRRKPPYLRRVHRFSLGKRPLVALLPAGMLETMTVQASDQLPNYASPIMEVWRSVHGGHKWLQYFPAYERAFSQYAGRPVRFLEIGVQTGASLRMWRKYLGDNAVVVGIDIDPTCAVHDSPEENVHVRIGSQADPSFLDRLVDEFGPFDAILDDGSHVVTHLVTTFGHLFEMGLKPGGVYVAEDTTATYWPDFRDRPFAFSDFCRDLTDLMSASVWGSTSARQFEFGDPRRHHELSVPRIGTMIERIDTSLGVVAIHKTAGEARLPVCAWG